MSECTISEEQVDRVRSALISYLKPHEPQALFLLGNLVNQIPASSLYVARKDGQIVGVCGYYSNFHSCSIFCDVPEYSRALARAVLQDHPSVKTVLGMADLVKPAYEEFLARGRRSIRDPEVLFLELVLSHFRHFQTRSGVIRWATVEDTDVVARLNRSLRQVPIEAPLTEDDRAIARSFPITACLEIDGNVVSVASSNGLAIQAFQILGVVTDPSYRRRGYARAVCSFLIDHMRGRGATRAVLFTNKDNTAAIQCYLGLGFQITDRYWAPWFQ